MNDDSGSTTTTSEGSTDRLGSDRGVVIPFVAIAILVLMAFVGFAVDLGQAYAVRRQSQSSADSAVLAAAQELVMTGSRGQAGEYAKLLSYDSIALQPSSTTAWDSEFASCTDSGALAASAPASSTGTWNSGATGCVTFSANNQRVRVRIPSQDVDTAFAQLVGVDRFDVSTFAEAEINFTEGGGGALPYAMTASSVLAAEICPNAGAGNVPSDLCSGSAAGNFGAIDWSLYGNVAMQAYNASGPTTVTTPTACSSSSADMNAAVRFGVNVMLGIDHPLGVIPSQVGNPDVMSSNASDIRNDRTICQAANPPNWLARPNQVATETGNNMIAGTQVGLIIGGIHDGQKLRGRLDRYCGIDDDWECQQIWTNRSNARNANGAPIDDTPLWEFLSDDLVAGPAGTAADTDGTFNAVPASCLPENFEEEDNPTKATLLACFEEYLAGGYDDYETVLFDKDTDGDATNDVFDIMRAPRFAFVPLLWPQPDTGEDWPSGQSDPVHIKAFRPIYLQTLWFGCNSNSCEGIHNPGEDWTKIGRNKTLDALSAMNLQLPMLPAPAREMAPTGPRDLTIKLVR